MRAPSCRGARRWVTTVAAVFLGITSVAACSLSGSSDAGLSAERAARCPVIDCDTTAPPLDAAISLDDDTVQSGATFSGMVTFTNTGEETVYFPYNGSTVQGTLFAPGTDTPVAVYTEPVTAAADGLAVPAGGSATLSLVGGTVPCGPDAAPGRLPVGKYDVRIPLVTHLSDPVSMAVTECPIATHAGRYLGTPITKYRAVTSISLSVRERHVGVWGLGHSS
jgi:hypothetical protein